MRGVAKAVKDSGKMHMSDFCNTLDSPTSFSLSILVINPGDDLQRADMFSIYIYLAQL